MGRLFVLLVAVGLAGCLSPSPVQDSFPDAEERFVRDSEDLDVTFSVPPGNVTVVLAVHYVLEPRATFNAMVGVVDGPGLANIDQVGPVTEKDPAWLTIRNATAGSWRITAELEGEGSYLFAAYFDAGH